MKVIALALLLGASQAHAAYNLRCTTWKHGTQLNASINMILTDVIGSTPENNEKYPSVITLVDENDTKKVIFSDDISHLNVEEADAHFRKIMKNVYPVRPGHDPLNPTPVAVEMRAIDFKLKLKPGNKLQVLEFDIDQNTRVTDTTFTGKGTIKISGREYKEATFNCGVYIEWNSYRRMVEKVKELEAGRR